MFKEIADREVALLAATEREVGSWNIIYCCVNPLKEYTDTANHKRGDGYK